jgi:lipopolysaccharide export system protein LptA
MPGVRRRSICSKRPLNAARYISVIPMRGTRWLLLMVIAVILGGIAVKYRAQKSIIRAQAPATPRPLADGLNAAADHYEATKRSGNGKCDIFHVTADSFEQSKDSSHVDLKNVAVKTYNKECTAYNLSRSAAATYFENDSRLYSDGDTEITLSIPIDGTPKHTPVTIKTSGVVVDVNTGRAETDRPSTFVFDNGDGKATGAFYDPTTHELQLKSGVEVNWKPDKPNAKVMKIEAATLQYHEAASEVLLSPWGRMTRGNTVVEGENVVIHLRETGTGDDSRRTISQVHAERAHGVDSYPTRKLQYSADDLLVDCDDDGEIKKITGQNNARLISSAETSETTVNANHVDLDLDVVNKESLLSHVNATGSAVVNARPLPVKGKELGETHVLRSDALEMNMRPGGHEMASVVTHAPGTVEFLPNLPVQHHRLLSGNDMQIAYGAQNRVDSFHATNAKTQTDPNAEEKKRNRSLSTTSSQDLVAHFDPKSGQMSTIEQTGTFSYAEGDRKALAQKASLDQGSNIIVLDGAARMWDSAGSTSADRIRMDQRTGDFLADGNVNSSHMPDKNPKKNSAMLSGDEPLQAKAHKMDSRNHNRVIHYEGDVVMWQGANRLTANVADLDRDKRTLSANGNVINYLWEQPKEDQKKKGALPVLTVVKAPKMSYRDSDRLALYSGGVVLTRTGMLVKSRELQAFLADSDADSRLEKAIADGAVEIVGTGNNHVRTGTAEHSEYYTDDQKVILTGGQPKLVDTMNGKPKGSIEGRELTYYANDDRLLGSGGPNQPVQSRIHRGK